MALSSLSPAPFLALHASMNSLKPVVSFRRCRSMTSIGISSTKRSISRYPLEGASPSPPLLLVTLSFSFRRRFFF